jgi:hypothetical protein
LVYRYARELPLLPSREESWGEEGHCEKRFPHFPALPAPPSRGEGVPDPYDVRMRPVEAPRAVRRRT